MYNCMIYPLLPCKHKKMNSIRSPIFYSEASSGTAKAADVLHDGANVSWKIMLEALALPSTCLQGRCEGFHLFLKILTQLPWRTLCSRTSSSCESRSFIRQSDWLTHRHTHIDTHTHTHRHTHIDTHAGRRQWPDPATLYFTPGIAEISKSKIKKKN